MGARLATLTAAVIAAVVTLLFCFVPYLPFAYRSEATHIAIETAAALIAGLAAFLVFLRFRQSARLGDLLLTCALLLVASSNLLRSVIYGLVPAGSRLTFSTWASLLTGLGGAGLFFAAAASGPRKVRRRTAGALWALGACAAWIAGAVGLAAALGNALPLPPLLPPAASVTPRPAQPPILLVLRMAGVLLFTGAAVGLARQAERRRDALLYGVAVSAVLAAFARVHYLLFPALYGSIVSSGDFFRLVSYLVLLAGALREILSHWKAHAAAAVLEERRRIARDLHDGMAQELAFIVVESRRLGEEGGAVQPVTAAAERALDESRRAIAALTEPIDAPFATVLGNSVREIADRTGTPVRLALDAHAEPPPAVREQLLRIAREAVTNAARHARARSVTVSLSGEEDGLCLRVSDDGTGFDPDERREGGFGLTSIAERAEAIGARLRLVSKRGAGTTVEVRLG
jgi:signal transduction histidine kinase